MDKKKSILNIFVSILGKILILFFTLLTRKAIIKYLGNDINGVNSLYSSIIGFLAVADLGIGSAITFSMYKPIVDNNTEAVAALYQLYRKVYFTVGVIVFTLGVLVIPFLPKFAKDYANINVNFSITFLLALLATSLSYFYSSKTSLINAHKNNYITSLCHTIAIVVQSIVQIFVIIKYRSFELYLISSVFGTLCQWEVTSLQAKRLHGNVLSYRKTDVDRETKATILKNIKAMFMHKIGTVMVNSADSVIISAFIGVALLGKYSNYTVLITAMMAIIMLVFTSLTSIVGHMFVSITKEEMRSWFSCFYYVNYILGCYSFLGYYAVVNFMIELFFGKGLILNRMIVMVITTNYFIQFMRQTALLFRDASGTFYYDRWKPLAEGIVNIILSVAFVCILPENYKISGVIIATILTNLLICHIVEPHIIYKYVFQMSAKMFIFENYFCILGFVIGLCTLDYFMVQNATSTMALLQNAGISIGISSILFLILCVLKHDFRKKMLEFLVVKAKRGI